MYATRTSAEQEGERAHVQRQRCRQRIQRQGGGRRPKTRQVGWVITHAYQSVKLRRAQIRGQGAPSSSSASATASAHRTRSVRGSRLAAGSTQLPNKPCASHRVVGGVLCVPPALLSPGGKRSLASPVPAAGTWCRATSSGVSCGQKNPAFKRASSALGRRQASLDIAVDTAAAMNACHSRHGRVRLRPHRVPTHCMRSMVSRARCRASLMLDNRSGGGSKVLSVIHRTLFHPDLRVVRCLLSAARADGALRAGC